MSSVLWQTWPEKFAEEGRARGLIEGELRKSRQILRRLLEQRFGVLPEALVQQVESCSDRQALDAALDQVLEIHALEELRLGREETNSPPSAPTPE